MLPTNGDNNVISLLVRVVCDNWTSIKTLTLGQNNSLKSTFKKYRITSKSKTIENFSYQDKSWAEFSTLDMGMCVQHVLHT